MKLAENFILHLRHFICYIKIVIIKTSPHIAERSEYVEYLKRIASRSADIAGDLWSPLHDTGLKKLTNKYHAEACKAGKCRNYDKAFFLECKHAGCYKSCYGSRKVSR